MVSYLEFPYANNSYTKGQQSEKEGTYTYYSVLN